MWRNVTDFQDVLGGLMPLGHRDHETSYTSAIKVCPQCVEVRKARMPIADALRRFTDGFGTLDLDLAMPELAMQIAAGNFPGFLHP